MTTVENQKTHAVPASRLAMGKWCHETNKQVGQGDISAANSADKIAFESKIRKPFRLQGWLHATVSLQGTASDTNATAYRLFDLSNFDGVPQTYLEASRKPKRGSGFYHGMLVTYGTRKYVLVGPPITINKSDELEPVQASLF